MRHSTTLLAVLTGLVCVAAAGAQATAGTGAGAGGTVILDTIGYWRNWFVLRPPVVRDGKKLLVTKTLTGDTPMPSTDWTAIDFDDSDWARTPGRPLPAVKLRAVDFIDHVDAGITANEKSSPALALLCMRGKFSVTDPNAVKSLELELAYRGGVVAYINNQRIGQASLPADSDPLVLAEDYGKAAFFRDDGEIARNDYSKNPAKDAAVWKARVRRAKLTIPADKLIRGTNVLCIEVHRTAYPKELPEWVKENKASAGDLSGILWATCGLLEARLTSGTAGGVVPNVSRPKGVQVWNSQLFQPDYDVDWGDPNEPLRPIRLSGTRGGVSSGKVCVGSDQAIKGLSAKMSDLAGTQAGPKAIPASAVQVRYALPTGWEAYQHPRYTMPADLLDGLADAAPAVIEPRQKTPVSNWSKVPYNSTEHVPFVPGAVSAVWVTVSVPDDAAPGDYKGTLTISAQGQTAVEVPVLLHVGPYRLPAPAQFSTVVDFHQSPESVALQYGAPLYSDKHFELVGKSFDRLGHLGNWTVHLPLICQGNLGNEQSMVRWVKKGDGWEFDFTVFDKYLDTAEKHMGKPRLVFLYVWDNFVGGNATRINKDVEIEDIPVSLLDKATGKVSTITVGRYDDKAKATWTALVGQTMERLKKRGLDKCVQLGAMNDSMPTQDIVDFWEEIAPGLPWMRYSHFREESYSHYKKADLTMGFQAYAAGEKWLGDIDKGQMFCRGWAEPKLRVLYFRINYSRTVIPWISMSYDLTRLLPEFVVQGPRRGFGRIGLDYWPVLKDSKGNPTLAIQGRYPKSGWKQLDAMIKCFVPPGPDGAMATAKLEMMREGLQETEARILIERALTDGKLKAKLGAPLAARCQKVLDERLKAYMVVLEDQQAAGFGNLTPWLDGYGSGNYQGQDAAIFRQWYMESGWQNRTAELYETAALVAEAIGR